MEGFQRREISCMTEKQTFKYSRENNHMVITIKDELFGEAVIKLEISLLVQEINKQGFKVQYDKF